MLDEEAGLEVALRHKSLPVPVRVRHMSLALTAPEQGSCTCDLALSVEITEATMSHHLKHRRNAGLIVGTSRGTNT